MAIELARRGVSCRIFDRALERSGHSRGLAVQARTIEVLERLGLAARAVSAGTRLQPSMSIIAAPGDSRSQS